MKHDAKTCNTYPAWVILFEHMADIVLGYRSQESRLSGHLADALEKCAMQFPIIESGECLKGMCPFTFFASFCRTMRPNRRSRLLECLIDTMGIDASGLSPRQAECPGLHETNARSLRFFSARTQTQRLEIDALWELFSCAILYADNPVHKHEDLFARAYNRVIALRCPHCELIPTMLSWIRPRFFLPTPCLDADAASCNPPKVDAYLASLPTPRNQEPACETTPVFDIAQKSWFASRAETPSFDRDALERLMERYLASIGDFRQSTQAKWMAVRHFQKQWNPNALDTHSMIASCLEGMEAIIPVNPSFNPKRDIVTIASKEPRFTQDAFNVLFDTSRPSVERIVMFESMIAQAFERHRGEIISAIPRRSSHGNFYAISAYLFLRFPEEEYLFSPRRINGLSKAVGYTGHFRIAEPESVEVYHDLCESILPTIAANANLVQASKSFINPMVHHEDNALHILIDDLAQFASSQTGVPIHVANNNRKTNR